MDQLDICACMRVLKKMKYQTFIRHLICLTSDLNQYKVEKYDAFSQKRDLLVFNELLW